MIWIIFLIIALATTLFLVTPFLAGPKKPALISLFMIGFMGAALALYAKLGTPTPPATQPISAQVSEPNAPNITQADINAMVEGLAARLAEEPDDSEGWTRLIRSRIVLGDVQALLKDHQAMSQYYAAQPEVLERINTQSGFTELARTLSEEAYTKREAP